MTKTLADRFADLMHIFFGHNWKRAVGYEAHDKRLLIATWECKRCGDVTVTALGDLPDRFSA